MKVNRTITREKAMTVLYQLFLYQKNKINYTISEVINEIIDDMDIEDRKKIDIQFLTSIVHGVIDNIEDIDIYISKYLENWSIERLGLTDQAIIRIATYELIYTDTPDLVCINEAIELAKKYSDEKVVKMINGVLDKIYHEREDNE
ncbi:MAG: transcription antitermination factor NusB [Bacilli bacterium]